jgi:hypothetical protein
MGLAPVLVDTYRTYKKGTGNVIQWLAETARATGTVNEVFQDTYQDVVPPTGGRLKGAAREAEKKARPTHNATAVCQITTKSCLILATAIATDARAFVPRSVFTTLRAVIRGRKDCAVWYATTSDPEDDTAKEKNAGHNHFIKTLENVLKVLKAKQPQSKHQSRKVMEAGPVRAANMYELLEDEELSESEEMPGVIGSLVEPAKEKVIYKLESSDADVSFAIFCFLKDATHIRIAVRRTWREFARGDIGLQAAALTMNAALAMIEALSNEFEEAHPRFKESETHSMHGKIIDFVYSGYQKDEGGPIFIDAGDEDNDPFAFKEGNQMLCAATVMCTHTMELIHIVLDSRKKPEDFRLSIDEKRFLKCVSQLASIPEEEHVFASYMVHKAASTMLWQGRLNSWIVFSLQIFWDMQRELGARSSAGEMLLSKTAQHLCAGYQIYLDIKGLENIGATHKLNRHGITRRKLDLETLVNNTQMQEIFDQYEQQAPWKLSNSPNFSILKCDSALCGVMLANIRDEYHRAAIDMASSQGQILVAAHLYNAAKCTGHLPKGQQWTDMDWLIEQQGMDWMFMGKKLENGLEFGKQVNLVMGVSAHKFTKNYKPGKEEETIVGKVRCLEYHARYSELCFNREPRCKKPAGESKAKNDILTMVDLLVKDYQGRAHGTYEGLSSLEKLRIFKLAIGKDEPALAFDVMDLYLRCIRLLQDVHKYARTVAPLDYPASRFNRGLSMKCRCLRDAIRLGWGATTSAKRIPGGRDHTAQGGAGRGGCGPHKGSSMARECKTQVRRFQGCG